MTEEKLLKVDIEQKESFVFNVDFQFENVPTLLMDEPKPIGNSLGPNATRVLSAAIGNCLCASLLFCLQKSRVGVSGMNASVDCVLTRNSEGRLRIKEFNVNIKPEILDDETKKMERCTEIFENFCVVSQSIRQGIPINVKINSKYV
jgi:uncharacterized OsmC-like protein